MAINRDWRVEFTRLQLEHDKLQEEVQGLRTQNQNYKARLSDHDLIEVVGILAAQGWAMRDNGPLNDIPWEWSFFIDLCEKAATAFDKRGITPTSHS